MAAGRGEDRKQPIFVGRGAGGNQHERFRRRPESSYLNSRYLGSGFRRNDGADEKGALLLVEFGTTDVTLSFPPPRAPLDKVPDSYSPGITDLLFEHGENSMTIAQELASYVVKASYDDLTESTRQALKVRVLDSLACAIGALEGEPIKMVREQIEDFGGQGHCTLIGGGRTAPDRAALYNVGLVRYLDFNDFYLAKHESLHPSDNLGAVLAACEYAHKTGKELLTSLAVAYHVQCRLSDEAPVRAKGFDHTTQGSYAVAAGVSKALGLDVERTANAIALCGTPFNALRVTRTGDLSHWKGLAYPNTAFGGTHSSFLAMRGVTGPPQVFEGQQGVHGIHSRPLRDRLVPGRA